MRLGKLTPVQRQATGPVRFAKSTPTPLVSPGAAPVPPPGRSQITGSEHGAACAVPLPGPAIVPAASAAPNVAPPAIRLATMPFGDRRLRVTNTKRWQGRVI